MSLHKGTTWDLLVSGEELAKIAKIRGKEFYEESISNKDLQSYLDKGWELKKEGKTKTQVKKKKPTGVAFEDELWFVFYKMGFKIMNSSNQFAISTSDDKDLGKQVDIIAIDDETCLFIECKEAEKEGTSRDFRLEINEMGNIKQSLEREIKKQYPGRKCKHIFATKNYKLGKSNRDLLNENNIYYFEDTTFEYYKSLSDYIGSASRYQLLGSLFAGLKISEMDVAVPAVKGWMGKKEYYTFLIEPSKLLKLGYVLHRTNANNNFEELLPSYQRLIKKDRLKKVREFVNSGRYFPNSIVVSIDAKRPLQFDLSSSQTETISKSGVLHLPQTYQSVYIIDGQHRLYGYSESDYADNNVIPVVAFVNLEKDEQLRLFFEINENQKAVSKTLRNILEIDIYDDSPNLNLRRKALLGRISKRLGEDINSAWYGKIAIGEDSKSNITLEYIKAAFDKTKFFTKYKKNNSIQERGLFDGENNDEIIGKFYPFFLSCINKVAEDCSEEWNSNGYLTTNNATSALIAVIGDIVSIVCEKDCSLVNDPKMLFEKCSDYLDALSVTIMELSADKRKEITEARGAAAKEKSYRALQMALHEGYPDFTNKEIENYVKEHQNYNDESLAELVFIKKTLIDFIKSNYSDADEFYSHAGSEVQDDVSVRLVKKNNANKRNGIFEEVSVWDELTFVDIHKTIGNAKNWSVVYQPWLHEQGYNDNKMNFIGLLKDFADDYSKIQNGVQMTLTQYTKIHGLYEILAEKAE